jgi:hypothetical protein
MRARSEEVMWREVEGQAIILDLRTSMYLTTNSAGGRMWKLLQDERTSGELEQDLIDTYGIDEGTARRDVRAFLDMLKENNLLVE